MQGELHNKTKENSSLKRKLHVLSPESDIHMQAEAEAAEVPDKIDEYILGMIQVQDKIEESRNLNSKFQAPQSENDTARIRLQAELESKIVDFNFIKSQLQDKIEENQFLRSQLLALQSENDTARTCSLQAELEGKIVDFNFIKSQLQDKIDENQHLRSQLLALQLKGQDERVRGLVQGSTDAREFVNAKFCMEESSFILSFAGLEEYHKGLSLGSECLIGSLQDPNAYEGIRREQSIRSNAKQPFTTPNYNVTTCPKWEWEFVVEPRVNFHYPHTPRDKSKWLSHPEGHQWRGYEGRDALPLKQFLDLEVVKISGLLAEEVVACRLYSGPMYILWNSVLRKFPRHVYEGLQGNGYETSLFCFFSSLVKLGRSATVEHRLYRGLGGALLPESFWSKKDGFSGGVERAAMSTTSIKNTAFDFSGIHKKRGTVLEILPNKLAAGADINILSQYPGEKENIFPPLTCLEVVGEPRVENEVASEHYLKPYFRLFPYPAGGCFSYSSTCQRQDRHDRGATRAP